MTYAEKIRSMSDKELAKITVCPYQDIMDTPNALCYEDNKLMCIDCCLEWLGSEVEE